MSEDVTRSFGENLHLSITEGEIEGVQSGLEVAVRYIEGPFDTQGQ